MSNIDEHIDDIDFRTWQARHDQATDDFVKWYKSLNSGRIQEPSERIEGQLTMLSAVLWYLLPPNDYKKLVVQKNGVNAQNFDDFTRFDNRQALL